MPWKGMAMERKGKEGNVMEGQGDGKRKVEEGKGMSWKVMAMGPFQPQPKGEKNHFQCKQRKENKEKEKKNKMKKMKEEE